MQTTITMKQDEWVTLYENDHDKQVLQKDAEYTLAGEHFEKLAEQLVADGKAVYSGESFGKGAKPAPQANKADKPEEPVAPKTPKK